MRVEILESAHEDLMDGFWFYENQEVGLSAHHLSAVALREGGT